MSKNTPIKYSREDYLYGIWIDGKMYQIAIPFCYFYNPQFCTKKEINIPTTDSKPLSKEWFQYHREHNSRTWEQYFKLVNDIFKCNECEYRKILKAENESKFLKKLKNIKKAIFE